MKPSKKGPLPVVGVLDLQGDVREHRRALEKCGAEVMLVKTPEDLAKVQALVMPGGESTTIGKLLQWTGLDVAIQKRVEGGMPIYATCAGAILLSKKIIGREKAPALGLLDVTLERNAYGRQIESFEAEVETHWNGAPRTLPAVFIRAPKIEKIGKGVKVLATWKGEPVLVQQDHLLASTFHPELTNDLTIHRTFLSLISPS
jgi:5'-phosphate synthase pdxT subunit